MHQDSANLCHIDMLKQQCRLKICQNFPIYVSTIYHQCQLIKWTIHQSKSVLSCWLKFDMLMIGFNMTGAGSDSFRIKKHTHNKAVSEMLHKLAESQLHTKQ